jgi:putative ubiquitin-RnfH superfamily antitoxin RatB of RatAB toxin-antitoxin module
MSLKLEIEWRYTGRLIADPKEVRRRRAEESKGAKEVVS